MASSNKEPLLRQERREGRQYSSTINSQALRRDEGKPAPYEDPNIKVYWYRWYILGLYSLVAALNNITWNTWGPIESSARFKYNWTKGGVSLLADWGAITFVLVVFPSAWLLDMRGESLLRRLSCVIHTVA